MLLKIFNVDLLWHFNRTKYISVQDHESSDPMAPGMSCLCQCHPSDVSCGYLSKVETPEIYIPTPCQIQYSTQLRPYIWQNLLSFPGRLAPVGTLFQVPILSRRDISLSNSSPALWQFTVSQHRWYSLLVMGLTTVLSSVLPRSIGQGLLTILGVFLLYSAILVTYRLFFHPLRKIHRP